MARRKSATLRSWPRVAVLAHSGNVSSETADGSIVDTARRHRVKAGTLKWWKWQLGEDAKRADSRRGLAPKLLPVVLAAGNVAQHSVVLEVADVTMRIEIGTDPHDVAALASALRSTC